MDEFPGIVALTPHTTASFDKILVMGDDKTVKENRSGLLQKIASFANGIADLSKLEIFQICRDGFQPLSPCL